jgi:hypothetical protein
MIVLALCILYVGDYWVVRSKAAKGREPFGSVQVTRYEVVPEKNNHMEFFYDAPETVECVHSLFPHFGDNPCWYASRHKEERTDD